MLSIPVEIIYPSTVYNFSLSALGCGWNVSTYTIRAK